METLTRADEPLPVAQSATAKRRFGFLKGQITVPDDIKTMFAEEIEEMFYGDRAQHKFDDIGDALPEGRCTEPEANS